MKLLRFSVVAIGCILLMSDTIFCLRKDGATPTIRRPAAAPKSSTPHRPAVASKAATKRAAKSVVSPKTPCSQTISAAQKEIQGASAKFSTTVKSVADISSLSLDALHKALTTCEQLEKQINGSYKKLFAALIKSECLDELNSLKKDRDLALVDMYTQIQKMQNLFDQWTPGSGADTSVQTDATSAAADEDDDNSFF